MRPWRGSAAARVASERRSIHVHDVLAEPEYEYGELIKQQGYRTVLAVPLQREGDLLGVIAILKTELEPFSDKQIELVETFADQAVIAIENARLFEEVQVRTRDLQESLEYQTATSEVLNVISRSPNELQPVLDAIVRTARSLCQAENAFVMRLDPSDGKYHMAAADTDSPEILAYVRAHPALPGRASISGRAAIERRPVHVVDTQSDPQLNYIDSAIEPTRTRLAFRS
jgi:hypothetical protein